METVCYSAEADEYFTETKIKVRQRLFHRIFKKKSRRSKTRTKIRKRNIARPFEKEYGIYTPCIMMDGRDTITRSEHLHELKDIIRQPATADKRELYLIVDELFDGQLIL